jgi:hypothetical protein
MEFRIPRSPNRKIGVVRHWRSRLVTIAGAGIFLLAFALEGCRPSVRARGNSQSRRWRLASDDPEGCRSGATAGAVHEGDCGCLGHIRRRGKGSPVSRESCSAQVEKTSIVEQGVVSRAKHPSLRRTWWREPAARLTGAQGDCGGSAAKSQHAKVGLNAAICFVWRPLLLPQLGSRCR